MLSVQCERICGERVFSVQSECARCDCVCRSMFLFVFSGLVCDGGGLFDVGKGFSFGLSFGVAFVSFVGLGSSGFAEISVCNCTPFRQSPCTSRVPL